MKRREFILSATGLVGAAAMSVKAETAILPPVRLVLVGDSTLQPGTGYGKAFSERLRPEASCLNLARGGRSSKSYRIEGAWDLALQAIAKPSEALKTYVLIQFGHNDGSSLPSRHTSLDEFQANMEAYARDTVKAGGVPVLITPVTMRVFKNHKLDRGLEPWAIRVRKAAKATDSALIDLFELSYEAVQAMGALQSEALGVSPSSEEALEAARQGTSLPPPPPTPEELEWVRREKAGEPHPPRDPNAPPKPRIWRPDYTHMGAKGAVLFSGLVAGAIPSAVPDLSPYIRQLP